MTKNIMIVGVGGQGTLLTSRILGGIATAGGYDVKLSEVHGMAQRGGSVVTFVRYGDQVAEPIVEEGQADVLIFPNIESGNAFYKSVSLFANADMAGLLQGPICPVVLPSRSDSGLSKYYSIAMAGHLQAGCECREKLNLNR